MMNVPAEIWRKHIEMGSSAEPMVMADASESGKSSRSHVWVLAAILAVVTLVTSDIGATASHWARTRERLSRLRTPESKRI